MRKNLGAKTPEDIGDYYAWGETATKSYYDEDNSKTFKWNILNFGVKDDESEYYYNLPNEYDVAYKKLGKEWSIPTMTQLLELWSECSWIPMFECDLDPSKEFDYSKEKFRGCKIIGKNGNSIYLPVTGAYQNGLNPNFAGEGVYQSKSGDKREVRTSSVSEHIAETAGDPYTLDESNKPTPAVADTEEGRELKDKQ